jgi:hypothetical protein
LEEKKKNDQLTKEKAERKRDYSRAAMQRIVDEAHEMKQSVQSSSDVESRKPLRREKSLAEKKEFKIKQQNSLNN